MSVPSLVPDLPSIDSSAQRDRPDWRDRADWRDRPDAEAEAAPERANRSFIVTWILSLTLGFLGADRFYTGRFATGGLKLLTLGGLGLWWIVDLVIVMAGGLRYNRAHLRGYETGKEAAWITTGFLLIVGYSLQLDSLLPALLAQLF